MRFLVFKPDISLQSKTTDIHFIIMLILRDVSFFTLRCLGINSRNLVELTDVLIGLSVKGHPSNFNQFRLLAIQTLKHIVFDLLYDESFNQTNEFTARKSFPNFDQEYELAKRTLLIGIMQMVQNIPRYLDDNRLVGRHPQECQVEILRLVDTKVNCFLIWFISSENVGCVSSTSDCFIDRDQFKGLMKHLSLL